MKHFFISLAATVTGILVSFFLLFIILVGIIGAAVGSATDETPLSLKDNSVLHIKLNYEIKERTPSSPFEGLNFGDKSNKQEYTLIGLHDIVQTIEKAKDDEKIKGILLDLSGYNAGFAATEEIRNALLTFKSSGKFITSYSEGYSHKTYYLATTADKIYLNPLGDLNFQGLSAQMLFFKNMLEKLEIEAQIFRHGKFKSAIEPFMLDKMSEANRQQTLTYLNSIWGQLVNGVAKERKKTTEELNNIANNLMVRNAEDAVKLGLVDELKYWDEVETTFKNKLGVNDKDEVNYIGLKSYWKTAKDKGKKYEKQKIAVIYAVGSIESGAGDDETIGSDRIAKAIADAGSDTTVKAIVLRVNSPGGSALASDVIWREVVRAKKSKPFIVSMGDVAASGGYYIACAADAIVAQPNTITGSIGVFGMMPNMQKLFSNKLGITVDTVNTNKHSDMGTALRPVTASEAEVIQQSVEEIYTTFITKVAEGRHKTTNEIDSIGQGRVWSGADGIKIGLVDELGGLQTAINLAAKKANLEKYRITNLPEQKDPIERFVESMNGGASANLIKTELGEHYEIYQQLKKIYQSKGVQARMPYELIIE